MNINIHMCLLFLIVVISVFITLYFIDIEAFAIYYRSKIDNKEYKVQEYDKHYVAADMLAKINKTIDDIVIALKMKYPNDKRVKRFVYRLKNTELQETEHKPNESSYTLNKGELISFCLRKKNEEKEFHGLEEPIMFVLIHELAHIMSITEGHTSEFMDNFRFLLKEVHQFGLYSPQDYSKKPITYCGVRVTHNPFHDT